MTILYLIVAIMAGIIIGSAIVISYTINKIEKDENDDEYNNEEFHYD